MKTEKFTADDINKKVSKLPSDIQNKFGTVKKSQTTAGLLDRLKRAAGSAAGIAIMEMFFSGTAVKDGGKIKRKYAGKSKIAKVMKSRKRKKK